MYTEKEFQRPAWQTLCWHIIQSSQELPHTQSSHMRLSKCVSQKIAMFLHLRCPIPLEILATRASHQPSISNFDFNNTMLTSETKRHYHILSYINPAKQDLQHMSRGSPFRSLSEKDHRRLMVLTSVAGDSVYQHQDNLVTSPCQQRQLLIILQLFLIKINCTHLKEPVNRARVIHMLSHLNIQHYTELFGV